MQLIDICELIIDCEHKTAPTQETGYPSIRTPNIGRGRFILDGVNRVSEETYRLWTKRAVPLPGDLIMAREAPVGNVAMIPEGIRPCLGQRTLLIRPDRAKVAPSFLNYFLNGPHVQGLIHAKTNGATVAHLNMKDVRTMDLPMLPPLPVQQRIAGILSAYDELIENSQRRIKILESMARALYREWFVHFRFPGFENHPRVASPLGEIPQGWEVKKLGEICSKLMDGTHDSPPPVEVGYPLITGRHIKGGFIDFSDAYFISPEEHQKVMKRSRPERGDIVYSNIGTLGATALVDQDFEYSIKNVALLKPLTPFHSLFLYCYLESPENLTELTTKASGTSQKFFSLQFLRTIELVVPPCELLALFTEKLKPILAARSLLNKQIQNLRRTRDLLLPRLLSGQIDVEAV